MMRSLVAIFVAAWLLGGALPAHSAEPVAGTNTEDPPALDVRTRPGGGVRASATLHIAAPAAAVLAVLTNYADWPNLFGLSLRLAGIERRAGGVLTDLYFRHAFLPGEQRLLCETRELSDGRLETSLVAGDFREYRRTWKVVPDRRGEADARLELILAVDTWVPDWLVALEVKRQLERHLRILREKVAVRRAGR